MTDKELLELAVKAAGEYHGVWSNKANAFIKPYGEDFIEWNPLTDDGDALRLAVKLRIEIGFDPKAVQTTSITHAHEVDGQTICPWAWAELTPDPYAATRRAIVRAAALIGKEMK